MSDKAEQQVEFNFFRRLNKFTRIRRFVIAWIVLLLLLTGGELVQSIRLSQYYQKLVPIAGGTYKEGIIGHFTNANPLYSTSPVDSAISKLIFSGLFKFNDKNQLVGDIASNWTVDSTGLMYTVTLRSDVVWHDGQPLTADDVVYTYTLMQNPDAGSPLQSSVQNIKITSPKPNVVTFTLPSPLVDFPYSLTTGIVPKHIIKSIPVSELRSASFNTDNPVGSGPFKWEQIIVQGDQGVSRTEQISLSANSNSVAPPKLQRFIIRTYSNEKLMLDSFTHQDINAMSGLDSFPDTLQGKSNTVEKNIPLTGETMVFFKTSSDPLNDVKVRRALVQAVNIPSLLRGLRYPVIASKAPILPNQIGYDKTLEQFTFNQAAANKLLDEDGWSGKNKDGIRTKNNKPLSFKIFAQSTSDYAYLTQSLQSSWRSIGVDAQVTLQSSNDLAITITTHDYDALLNGISIGPDPDVFAYWDSTEADPRLTTRYNFSEYKNPTVDNALAGGRTRSDVKLRTVKYKPFLENWRNDAPALALYQPRYLYITRGPVYNFEPSTINAATDRYANVNNWMIREGYVNQ
ncbi:MAG: peptide ABC transporter substrate-binding protein [Candidatus Saccharimonadales bacterium]